MTRTQLQIGTVLQLGEKAYLITDCIGRGGSSLIYSAYNIKSNDEKVALKELYPNQGYIRDDSGQIVPLGDSPWTLEQLEKLKVKNRSAKVLSRQANDSNFYVFPVNDVFDTAQLHLPDGSQHTVYNQYSVMNDLQRQGVSLAQYIGQYREIHQGRMPLSQIITLMETVLHSYVPLHRDGFIHGDIQPDNIHLMDANPARGQCGIACIIDFGEAWSIKEEGKTETITLDVPLFSTHGYTPPEIQYRKSELQLTAAADVYSLGVLMLCLASHCEPYPTSRLYSSPYLKQVWNNDLLDCSQTTLRVLNRVLYKALENEPDSRYQNAGEFLDDIYHLKDCHNITFDRGLTVDALLHGAEVRFRHKTAGLCSQETDSNGPQDRLIAKIGGDKTCKLQELLESSTAGGYLIETEFDDEYYSYLVGVLSNRLESGDRIPVLLDFETLTYSYAKKAVSQEDMLSYMLAEDLLGDTSEKAVCVLRKFLADNPDKFCIIFRNLQCLQSESKPLAEAMKNTLQALSKAGAWIIILNLVKDSPSKKGWYSKEMANSLAFVFSFMSGIPLIVSLVSSPILQVVVGVVFGLAFVYGSSWVLEKKSALIPAIRKAAVSFGCRHNLIVDTLFLVILAVTGGISLWMSSCQHEIGVECAQYAMYLLTTVIVLLCSRDLDKDYRRGIPPAVYAVLALAISKLTFHSFTPGLICVVLHTVFLSGRGVRIAFLSAVFALGYHLVTNGITVPNHMQADAIFLLFWVLMPWAVCYIGAWKLGMGKRGILPFSLLIGGIVAICLTLFVHPEIQSGRMVLCKTDWIAEIPKLRKLLEPLFAKGLHGTVFGNTLDPKPGWVIFGNFLFVGYFINYMEHYDGVDPLVINTIVALSIFTIVTLAIGVFTGEALPPNTIPGMVLIYPLFGSALSCGERNLFANVTSF